MHGRPIQTAKRESRGLIQSAGNPEANPVWETASLRRCGEKVIGLAAFALANVQVIGPSGSRGVLDAHNHAPHNHRTSSANGLRLVEGGMLAGSDAQPSVITTTGLIDAGQATILATTRGLIQPIQQVPKPSSVAASTRCSPAIPMSTQG